ncbi:hypothetical protein Q5424_20115 [Conexibacter sp. JD483]|uniref:hypothetical protein n=1 Tax=unclassified Conexibacter TaxID=2627773 RepID=UPI00271A50A8|nr:MULTISPECIES: hypothetical protein [unclassified Conexibacter]MDO8188952.1 hypothetical protein [Conexibacter sp. CPCC 205706]MDO8201733.1 hypothetical protein [Conexibacter sp. CPCC 205762]MDR9371416.1 hypothetical protein [Conexibacter sp. JD483]
MRKLLRSAAIAASVAAVAAAAAPAASEAASPGDLCLTNQFSVLYLDANTLYTVAAGTWVRILDYRGTYHYLARVDGLVGQIERVRIDQASCH